MLLGAQLANFQFPQRDRPGPNFPTRTRNRLTHLAPCVEQLDNPETRQKPCVDGWSRQVLSMRILISSAPSISRFTPLGGVFELSSWGRWEVTGAESRRGCVLGSNCQTTGGAPRPRRAHVYLCIYQVTGPIASLFFRATLRAAPSGEVCGVIQPVGHGQRRGIILRPRSSYARPRRRTSCLAQVDVNIMPLLCFFSKDERVELLEGLLVPKMTILPAHRHATHRVQTVLR
jgi:hypothetical protein